MRTQAIHNLCNAVHKANLPHDSFIIAGSGPLWVRGLVPARDADVLVTLDTFYAMIDRGFVVKPFTWIERLGETYLVRDNIELYQSLLSPQYLDATDTFDLLLDRADVIFGLPFVSIQDMARLKRRIAHLNSKHAAHADIAERFISLALPK